MPGSCLRVWSNGAWSQACSYSASGANDVEPHDDEPCDDDEPYVGWHGQHDAATTPAWTGSGWGVVIFGWRPTSECTSVLSSSNHSQDRWRSCGPTCDLVDGIACQLWEDLGSLCEHAEAGSPEPIGYVPELDLLRLRPNCNVKPEHCGSPWSFVAVVPASP